VALKFLGRVQQSLGQLTNARDSWAVAFHILTDLGDWERAQEIESDLAALAANED
jgi:hypothetical protein